MYCYPGFARTTASRQESERKDQVMDQKKKQPWILLEYREGING